MFLTMAVNAAFDWVFLANSDYVRLSVIPNCKCTKNTQAYHLAMVFKLTLGPVLLAGTNFSVLIDCCIWRVLTLAFSYSCSIHNYYR